MNTEIIEDDVKLHCREDGIFKQEWQTVRGFTYTNYSIYPHNHYFYEMNIVMGGTGVHRIGKNSVSVRSGDVFVIPPMTVHSYDNTENLEVYHVILKSASVREKRKEAASIPGFFQLMEIEPFLRSNRSETAFLRLTPSQLTQIKEELRFIQAGGEFDRKCYASLQEHSAWKMVYYLSHLLHEQINSEKRTSTAKYHRQILDSLEFIHQNYSEKISVESLAERAYLSRSTFLRSFRNVCGCSPIQYLTRYRVKKAIELLENEEKSKTEIAHACGFYDLSHMERSVKKADL